MPLLIIVTTVIKKDLVFDFFLWFSLFQTTVSRLLINLYMNTLKYIIMDCLVTFHFSSTLLEVIFNLKLFHLMFHSLSENFAQFLQSSRSDPQSQIGRLATIMWPRVCKHFAGSLLFSLSVIATLVSKVID